MKYQTVGAIEAKLLDFVPKINSNKYTLDTVKKLASFVGNPEDRLRVVHIAGTSGKTTTSYYVARLLAKSGARVGLTVSPHIVSLTERAQLLGDAHGDEKFIGYFNEFVDLIEGSGIQPSYFELMMVFALWMFDKEKVDYAVVETGLGGLLDASNICRRSDKVAVITDIGYDHMEILGSTLGEIAAQKAGIIAENNACFLYRQSVEIMQSIELAVQKHRAELHVITDQKDEIYLKRNFHLAKIVMQYISSRDGVRPLTEVQASSVYLETHVPGRLEKLRVQDTIFVLDGAHNEPKMRTLCHSLQALYPGRKWPVILAMKSTKDYHATIGALADIARDVIVSEFQAVQDVPIRSVPLNDLARECQSRGIAVQSADTLESAAMKYLQAGEEMILVTGSFYAISELRIWLIDSKQAKIEV